MDFVQNHTSDYSRCNVSDQRVIFSEQKITSHFEEGRKCFLLDSAPVLKLGEGCYLPSLFTSKLKS